MNKRSFSVVLIIFSIIIIFLGLFVYMTDLLYFNLHNDMLYYSESIQDSKEHNVFLEEYRVDTTKSDLILFGADKIEEIWVEYSALTSNDRRYPKIDSNDITVIIKMNKEIMTRHRSWSLNHFSKTKGEDNLLSLSSSQTTLNVIEKDTLEFTIFAYPYYNKLEPVLGNPRKQGKLVCWKVKK